MRDRLVVGLFVLAAAASGSAVSLRAAPPEPPKRKPLGTNEREAVLALVKAVDLAQATDSSSDPALGFEHHVLRSGNYTGYVPFTLTTAGGVKSTAMYVRAV